MSADLLVRLRRAAMAPESLLAQAADEIERLRKPAAAPVSGDVAQITRALEIGLESALDLFSDEPRATISEMAKRVDTIHAAIRALKEGK